ncbi:methylaspartate mutase [Streptomyces sp. SID3343]|uniref:methylaspartate mutase n=1 Tax=Streptomyces sp. SID3343 TaxID=2690260 RepID=UPI0031F8B0F2
MSARFPSAVPDLADSVGYIRSLNKPSVADVLRAAHRDGRVAVQARCGVGSQAAQLRLLQDLEEGARPDIQTLTIDAHTRMRRFAQASRCVKANPQDLNGYPLVAHGWQRGRELNEATQAPIQIRHGSPHPWALFEVTIASGITAFEGGGICYNLPYAKNFPLSESLAVWRDVDAVCGDLARQGIVVDREFFGTLTAVLIPPSTSLAISVLEAWLAAREGVRCLSIAYPQGGEVIQDVATLRCIPRLARRYLPGDAHVYPVLHQYMGPFPAERPRADALIFYGALVARLGRATKVLTKTHQEAFGIPDTHANLEGLATTGLAATSLLDFVTVNEDQVSEEADWIEREVAELVEPILACGDPRAEIPQAFADGRLDIPFSASRLARSDIIPMRDPTGAIRYLTSSNLPFSTATSRRNQSLLEASGPGPRPDLIEQLTRDINFFAGPGDPSITVGRR